VLEVKSHFQVCRAFKNIWISTVGKELNSV